MKCEVDNNQTLHDGLLKRYKEVDVAGGVGASKVFIVDKATLSRPDATNLTAILLAGSNAPLPVEHAFMPPFARGHTDDELAAVANFVNGFFGNGATKVTAADIDKARKALP